MNHIEFISHPATEKEPDLYTEIHIDTAKTLKSWSMSLMSFEWLDKKGNIKPTQDLKAADQDKRAHIENAIKNGQSVTKPILGIGMYDNVEIGSGRVEFLALAAHGFQTMPVHVRKSQLSDFQEFLADVS